MSDFIAFTEDTSDIQSLFLVKSNTNPELINCPIHITYDDSTDNTGVRIASKSWVQTNFGALNYDRHYTGNNNFDSIQTSQTPTNSNDVVNLTYLKTNYPEITSSNTFSGTTNLFTGNLRTTNVPTSSNDVVNLSYFNSNIPSTSNLANLGASNTFSGTLNTFTHNTIAYGNVQAVGNLVTNGNLSCDHNIGFGGTINSIPASTFGYIGNLTSDVQAQINSISLIQGPTGPTGPMGPTGASGLIGATGPTGTSGATILGNTNSWTGSNIFNTTLPTSNLTPTASNQ